MPISIIRGANAVGSRAGIGESGANIGHIGVSGVTFGGSSANIGEYLGESGANTGGAGADIGER